MASKRASETQIQPNDHQTMFSKPRVMPLFSPFRIEALKHETVLCPPPAPVDLQLPLLESAPMPSPKIETQTIAATLAAARQRLAGRGENPGLDSEVLLAGTLGLERSWLLAHPEAAVSG